MSDLQVIRDALPEGEAREAFERMARLLSDVFADDGKHLKEHVRSALLARFRELEELAGCE